MSETFVILDTIPTGIGEHILNKMVPVLYEVAVKYVKIPGALQIPLADADGADCLFVKTHADMWQKHIDYTVSCVGDPPPLPDYLSSNPNVVLLDAWFDLVNPRPVDDKSLGRSARGYYRYGFIRPPNRSAGELKTAFTVFWDRNRTIYTDGNFRQDIIDW